MRRTILLIFAFFFFAFGNLPLCAQVEPSYDQDAAESASTPREPAAKAVTSIEVKGNKSISTNTILSKMKTRVGSPYLENVVSDDLKRLYLLGYFSDINIDTEDYQGGVKVVVRVAERPIIEKILFSGIRRLTMKEEKLKELLKTKENQYLDHPRLAEDVEIIRKLYEKKGFGDNEITTQVDTNKETNKAKVTFSVTEGRRVKIKNIIVEGNNAFSDSRILKLMKTKRAWLLNAGALKEDVLEEDMERIRAFYRKHGFADIAASYEVQRSPKASRLIVLVRVEEGKKYLVGSVSLSGNDKISKKEIQAALKDCTPGKVFSQEALRNDIVNVQGIYFDRGYIFAQVQDSVSLNPETGRIDISYAVTENDVAYV
ncbi:MAG: POTRA domain-containing protein, partial [Candidatus Omnitrophica bacterium]|nr:POTRA domain-containing protein [Candidatus Omnitrophota bacterium]